ncbi:MAG: MFS transporter, partial [Nocardiopsaceae bacterium]|nr:MFS transporter [Nocardiopsaceae bacterium]
AARGGLDLPGAGLAAVALFAIVLPLTMGHQWGWPWWTAPVLLASVPVAAVFLRRQRRLESAGRSPLIPPSLLRQAGVGWGLAMIAVFGSGITAFFWLLALDLQAGRGMDPAGAGLMMVPLAVAFAAASLSAPRLSAPRLSAPRLSAPRLSPARPERVVIGGSVVTALGYLAMAAVATPPLPVAAIVLAVIGAGQGLAITPMLGLALRAVPSRQAGAGAGLVVTAQQLGSALGVCLFGLVFYGAVSHGGAGFHGGPGAAVIPAFRVTIATLPVTALAAALIARRLSAASVPKAA